MRQYILGLEIHTELEDKMKWLDQCSNKYDLDLAAISEAEYAWLRAQSAFWRNDTLQTMFDLLGKLDGLLKTLGIEATISQRHGPCSCK